ncbi:MAG: hypothetical protein N2595_00110, partial [bacterium]|nr:hypothetical protein [bacterium]
GVRGGGGRENMPRIGAVEIHRWRAAFRALHGKDVWGHEGLPGRVQRQIDRKVRRVGKGGG